MLYKLGWGMQKVYLKYTVGAGNSGEWAVSSGIGIADDVFGMEYTAAAETPGIIYYAVSSGTRNIENVLKIHMETRQLKVKGEFRRNNWNI